MIARVSVTRASARQVRQIANSIKKFGFCNPVLIDDAKQIIVGHGRVEAAKVLGIDAVPTCRLSHLSAAEAMSASLRKRPKCCIAAKRRYVPIADVSRCSKPSGYSITSSATLSTLSGTLRPSIVAVWALMTNSNLFDCTTSRSAGMAPLTMRPA